MKDQIRGDDAADHASKDAGRAQAPVKPEQPSEQDAANYEVRVDQGLAEPVETMNSANDE